MRVPQGRTSKGRGDFYCLLQLNILGLNILLLDLKIRLDSNSF